MIKLIKHAISNIDKIVEIVFRMIFNLLTIGLLGLLSVVLCFVFDPIGSLMGVLISIVLCIVMLVVMFGVYGLVWAYAKIMDWAKN